MKPLEIIADIKKELTEHPERWIQRRMRSADFDPNAKACLVGMISKRTYQRPELERSHWPDEETYDDAYADALSLHYATKSLFDFVLFGGDGLGSIPHWNDDAQRTVEDVVALCQAVLDSPACK